MIAYTSYEFDGRVQRAVAALTGSGHHVDFFTISDGGPAAGADSRLVRIYLLRMRKEQAAARRYGLEYGVFLAWAFGRVSFLHARRRYDVVYVHNMPNFLVLAGLLAKLSGAKIVLDVHDPAAELLASLRGGDLPSWLRRLASAEERVSLAFADAVITVNESMRQRIRAISRRPVTVVMNLPDPAVFVPPRVSRGRGDLEWLVYSGTVAYRQGADLAVRALSRLAAEFPRLRLRVIGDGPALGSVVRLAEECGVADRVEFLGFVPHGQIPALVSDAAAGISLLREDVFGALVFSTKVAEYVTLGLPVICSGTSAMRQYFGDDELLFFESGNADDLARAIRDLLTCPAAAAERAARSQVKLDKLDWSAQRKTLVETVEALADSGAKGRTPGTRTRR
jgi:glycosyltransferase involved in cell wall biosynthesis